MLQPLRVVAAAASGGDDAGPGPAGSGAARRVAPDGVRPAGRRGGVAGVLPLLRGMLSSRAAARVSAGWPAPVPATAGGGCGARRQSTRATTAAEYALQRGGGGLSEGVVLERLALGDEFAKYRRRVLHPLV
jgi:hypothetical protein